MNIHGLHQTRDVDIYPLADQRRRERWNGAANGHDCGPQLLLGEPAECEAAIPRREYVVPGFLQRGVVTQLVGPGGAGKGQLIAAWAVSAALGRHFGAFRPEQPLRVLHFSIEDDLDEQRARIAAVMRWFGATRQELAGRLRLATARELGLLVRLDEYGQAVVRTALMAEIESAIREFRPDLSIFDPLAEMHDAPENSNGALRMVGAELRLLAWANRMALLLTHYVRKGVADPGNMDAGRGGSSMANLVRKAFTLYPMTDAEAAGWKLASPSHYFRLDGAKANYDAKNGTEWFERVPVLLDNGDVVARAEPWTPPRERLTDEAIGLLLDLVKAGDGGQPWTRRLGKYDRSVSRAMERVGITSPEAQRAALDALVAAGVKECGWWRANRMTALGLRHPDGGPDIEWTE